MADAFLAQNQQPLNLLGLPLLASNIVFLYFEPKQILLFSLISKKTKKIATNFGKNHECQLELIRHDEVPTYRLELKSNGQKEGYKVYLWKPKTFNNSFVNFNGTVAMADCKGDKVFVSWENPDNGLEIMIQHFASVFGIKSISGSFFILKGESTVETMEVLNRSGMKLNLRTTELEPKKPETEWDRNVMRFIRESS